MVQAFVYVKNLPRRFEVGMAMQCRHAPRLHEEFECFVMLSKPLFMQSRLLLLSFHPCRT